MVTTVSVRQYFYTNAFVKPTTWNCYKHGEFCLHNSMCNLDQCQYTESLYWSDFASLFFLLHLEFLSGVIDFGNSVYQRYIAFMVYKRAHSCVCSAKFFAGIKLKNDVHQAVIYISFISFDSCVSKMLAHQVRNGCIIKELNALFFFFFLFTCAFSITSFSFFFFYQFSLKEGTGTNNRYVC